MFCSQAKNKLQIVKQIYRRQNSPPWSRWVIVGSTWQRLHSGRLRESGSPALEMVFRLRGKVGRIQEALFKLMGTITESFGVRADHFVSGQHQIIPAFSAHFTAVLQHCLDFEAQDVF